MVATFPGQQCAGAGMTISHIVEYHTNRLPSFMYHLRIASYWPDLASDTGAGCHSAASQGAECHAAVMNPS